MAPVTTIGSAQPVMGSEPVDDPKIINALTEKLVSLAELHGRNATQATRFVTHNDNLTPEKAHDRNVIEAMADSPQDLLLQAHGATVTTLKGQRVLDTQGAQIVTHEPSLRVIITGALADPLLATILLTVGFLALIYGLTSPGFGVEIAAAVLIILGLVGQGFDINWAAFALLAIGVGLISYELVTPGFGAIGIGGIIVLSIGITFMITQPVRPLLVTQEHLAGLALLSATMTAPFAAFFGFITYKVWKAKTKKPLQFAYQSEVGVALDPISADTPGFVQVGGELWSARSAGALINKGEKVRILEKQGDTLVVEALKDGQP
jgi:membrane-bound serine protease (ClpP class)